MRLSALDANYPKSQNTHLHIIEPYANLYRTLKEFHTAESCDYVPAIGSVLPIGVTVPHDDILRVEAALRNIIGIFTDKILNPETHHLDLFFDMDWRRGAGHLESYGHDIECSWLIHEAALVLGDRDVLDKVEPIVRLVAQASEKGLRPDGSLIHENNDCDLHWWVQAENVVGWLNLYQYFGDRQALEKALRCYQYIKDHLVDWEHGEWYWSRRADGTVNRDDDKAGFWKCPYHNSRMCLEIIERL
jgi:mannobiose 2-epimerase